MQLTDAHWEHRNLGCRTAELSFSQEDTEADLPESCFSQYGYVIAKVPTGCLSLLHQLENLGFRYLETQVELACDLRQLPSHSSAIEAILRRVTTEEVTSPIDQSRVIAEITPDMFETDRVSQDPTLGAEVAARRYQNWMRDVIDSGEATLSELLLGRSRVGFFLLRHLDEERSFATLAALYGPFKGRGLGVSIVAKPIEWAMTNSRRWLVTRNSSNNLESLKLHLACGYKLVNMLYLLRWAKPQASHLPTRKES